jgi:hypothetical protein
LDERNHREVDDRAFHFTYTIGLGVVSATRIVVTGYLLTFCQEPGEVNYSVAGFRDLRELCRVVASGLLQRLAMMLTHATSLFGLLPR